MNQPLRYRVREVKAKYGRDNQIRNETTVVQQDLFSELESRGVPRKAWDVQSGHGPQLNGEYTEWKVERGSEMTTPKYCGCGCGQPVSAKATFRQGHDQALISKLALWTADCNLDVVTITRLGLAEDVNDVDIQTRIDGVSSAVAKLFSPPLASKYYSAAMRRWEKAGRVKAPAASPVDVLPVRPPDTEELEKLVRGLASQPEVVNGEMGLDAPVRIKVGRWEYNAVVQGMNTAGKVTAVRYYNLSQHKEIVKTEGQFKLV